MANERIPNDPYRASNPADDPYRINRRSDDINSPGRLDDELQIDPELAEGPASGGRIAMFAVGIAVILGAVFYGLNNSSINQASTAPPATTAQNTTPAAPSASPPPPGMRDVTPHANNEPGTTTGSASDPKPLAPKSADPKARPAPAPSGGTE